jgi:hypothetical protein
MKKIALFVLFVITLNHTGCYKPIIKGTFLLTDEMKAQNPFKGGEKIYFVSDSGKLFTYNCDFRRDTVIKTICSIEGDYCIYEEDETFFKMVNDTTGTNYFSLKMCRTGVDPLFFVYFNKNKEEGTISFEFDLPLSNETSDFIDSIQVLDKWYYNIYKAENKKDEKISKLYYSTEYGIVKLDFSDGSYWQLKNIIGFR